VVVEDLLDDVRDGFILEDPAVRGSRQKPEPGIDRRVVREIPATVRADAETGDIAVKVARALIAQSRDDAYGLSQQVFRLKVWPGAEQADLRFAEHAQAG
jgi:hypothetical protein